MRELIRINNNYIYFSQLSFYIYAIDNYGARIKRLKILRHKDSVS